MRILKLREPLPLTGGSLGLVGNRCGVQSSAWVSSQRHLDPRETSFLWITFFAIVFFFFPTNSREYIQPLTFFDLLCHILKNCILLTQELGMGVGDRWEYYCSVWCADFSPISCERKVSATLGGSGKGRDSRHERKQFRIFLNQCFLHL